MELILSVGHRAVYRPSHNLWPSIQSNRCESICWLPNRGDGLAIHLLVLYWRDVVFRLLNLSTDLHICTNLSFCGRPDGVGYFVVPICEEVQSQMTFNPALDLAPFSRWMLRYKAAQRRLALR